MTVANTSTTPRGATAPEGFAIFTRPRKFRGRQEKPGARQCQPGCCIRARVCASSSSLLSIWRAGHREILELAVVEPVQGDARGVTLVARDDRREEAVDETAPARQPNCGSPGKWPGGGGRNGGQHRHGCFLSKSSRKPVSLPAPFLSKACCQHGVSRLRRGRANGDECRTRLDEDQNEKRCAALPAGRSPPAMPGEARQATFRPAASSLTASVVNG